MYFSSYFFYRRWWRTFVACVSVDEGAWATLRHRLVIHRIPSSGHRACVCPQQFQHSSSIARGESARR